MKTTLPARAAPALIALTTLLLAACSEAPPPADEVRPVRYTVADASGAAAGARLPGEVRARTESRLAFRVGGKIVEKYVMAGEHVKKGQVLARLDASDYQLEQAAKAAQLSAAEADLLQQETDLKRARELLAKNFVSQAQVDRQENGVAAARARLTQARAQLAVSRNQTGYASLVADADGVIAEISAEPGSVVAAGAPVARLAADGEREVAVAVPEQMLDAVRGAKSFSVSLWANGQTAYPGTLRELAADADPATRTYAARIRVAAPADALKLGMTATVALPGSANVGVRLPLTALLDEKGRHYVWLIDKKTLKVGRTEVKVAALDDKSVTLAAGVPAGSLVATAGVHLLRDGQRVSLLKE
ncbi:RND family efflux transporter MFP subunit [Crenobacter luteus]|uniref:Efflux transporter periplasmic adaptor subunit n=1 Tax=Crenobacter luteus TaxID=1452487 RepID=A0A161S837_9NEIS|nr:efflux RND transporter periplasmic adaptor subunit [Crenobacter luteus]KZE29713.1 efflux transporter periplasmic adaptor subunit [Crenobacter luteus]TCP11862.1 RND family efflux transporter MFP subunit [Crenobacter luteus]